MTKKQKRLTLVVSSVSILTVATLLVLSAMRDSVVYFFSPSEIVAKDIGSGQKIRIGGLVQEGSVERSSGATVRFIVTDMETAIPVTYAGILPDLFREGQGVVVEGSLDQDNTFVASTVLAKHDENYMPPEVADALKKSGHWEAEG